jgi:hypothetical protein
MTFYLLPETSSFIAEKACIRRETRDSCRALEYDNINILYIQLIFLQQTC